MKDFLATINSRFLQATSTALLVLFLFGSFLYPGGNKFDAAYKIYLILGFGWLSVAIFLIALIIKKNSQSEALEKLDEKKHDPQANFILSLAGALLGYVVWTLISFWKSQAANFGFTEVIMLLGTALIILSAWIAGPKKLFNTKVLFESALFFLVINALAGIVLYLSSHHTRAFGFYYNPEIRTDAWPNAFALFILFLWPLFLYYFYFWQSKRRVWLIAIAFSFVLSSFFLTFSRAAFLAFVGQIFLVILFSLIFFYKEIRQNFPWKKILQCFGIVLLTWVITTSAQYARENYFQKKTIDFLEKTTFSASEEVTSFQERVDFMKGAAQLALKEPVFGFGPGSFGYIYRSIQKDWLAIADHPHNIFLKIGMENGLPALFFFTAFLLLLAFRIFKNFRFLPKENRALLLIVGVAFLGGLAHNLVDYNLNFVTNYVIFWLLLLFIYEFSTSQHKKTTSNSHNIILISGLIVLLPTVLLTGYESIIRADVLLTSKKDPHLVFQKLEASLFPKYLFLEQAGAYRYGKNTEYAQKLYEQHIAKNKWDASYYHQTGQFYKEQGQNEKALEHFQKALELDAKNSWQYYYDTLETLSTFANNDSAANHQKNLEKLIQKTQAEMKQYLPKVEHNMHYTAQHQESLDALKTLKLLLRIDPKNAAFYRECTAKIEDWREKYNGTIGEAPKSKITFELPSEWKLFETDITSTGRRTWDAYLFGPENKESISSFRMAELLGANDDLLPGTNLKDKAERDYQGLVEYCAPENYDCTVEPIREIEHAGIKAYVVSSDAENKWHSQFFFEKNGVMLSFQIVDRFDADITQKTYKKIFETLTVS